MKRNLQKPVEGELERLGFFQSLCSKWPRLVDRGNRRIAGGEMTDNITVSREQAGEIFKALNGIGKLLKMLPSKPENAAVMYAIMSNLTVIQMNLTRKQVSN